MRTYELTIILPEKFKDSTQKKVLADIQESTEKLGAKFGKVEKIGKKKLAYPINKNKFGHYFFVEFEAEPSKVAEINRNLTISEEVLRHLVTEKRR